MRSMLGSSSSRSNPLGALSIVTGLAAALASAVLWIYRVHPESLLLGRYSAEVAGRGQLAQQLTALAAVLGLMAILTSIMTSSGG